MWPVGFAKKSFYQRPVCVKDKLVSWNCAGNCSKNDLIDPSSFSIHLKLLVKNKIYIESETYLDFILKLVDFDQIEPVKIENCTRVIIKFLRNETKKFIFYFRFWSGIQRHILLCYIIKQAGTKLIIKMF